MPKLKIKPSLKRKSSEWEIISDDTPMAQNGRITLDEFRPKFANSNESIQQNIKKQQEINKIKNQINFPLYKSNENTEELKAQIGDQSEVLKNIVWKDQIPEYIKNIKNHPENEKFWHKETLEKAKNYTNDTSRYLAAFQLLKENGNPYITQNPYFEDKYRKSINSKTSNFRDSKNLMYLEPNDRDAFIAELSHAQQLKDNFLEDKNVSQKLDSIYKKQKQTNPNIDYHEVYDKYYYNMPNSIEYDAHTLRQPKLEERYYFLTDSFKNELPFMSFTPQYKVNEKIKLDNAGKDYYKGNIGNLRRIINKGVDNIFGTDIYKAFGNDPKKYKSGGSISQQGYRDDSPYRNRKSININTPTGLIDMSETGIPILANNVYLPPYSGMHQFEPGVVKEERIMQDGGFTDFYNSINPDFRDTTNYNLKRAYELLPKETLDKWVKNPNKNHLPTVGYIPENNTYEFLKSKNHPTQKLELDWYNSNKAKDFRKQYDIDSTGDYYKYVPKMQQGGRTPIKGTKEQAQAYQDSLSLYNRTEYFKNIGEYNPDVKKGHTGRYYADYLHKNYNKFTPVGARAVRQTNPDNNLEYLTNEFPVYKKPVQPIIYQPEEKKTIENLKERFDFVDDPNMDRSEQPMYYKEPYKWKSSDRTMPISTLYSYPPDLLQGNNQQLEFNPIGFQKGSYFTRPRQSQEIGDKLEYFDKKTGKKLEFGGNIEIQNEKYMAKNGKKIKLKKAEIGKFMPNTPLEQDPEFRIGDQGFNEQPYTPIYNPNEFNPSLTYGLENYNQSKGYNFNSPSLSQNEQGQYNTYRHRQSANPWQDVGQQMIPSMDNLQNLPLATIPNITNSKWWAKADKHLQAGQQKAVKAGQELVSGFTGGAGGGGAGDMMKMFSKKHGGYIPKMTGGGMMNWLNAASYGLGATADFAAMGMDTTGALLDTFGTMNVNNQIEQWKNDNKKQFAFNKAENLPPIEQYGYQFQGRNNALYETGGSIKEIGGQGFPNVEIEGGENVDLPDGYSEQVNGLSHAEGGIKLNLPEGTKVYSKKLIHPETGKSYAKMAKKLETKKDFEHKESKYSDKINQATADLNISLKDTEKDKLFLDQEIRKIDGEFGKKVKESTLNDYKMKFGGLKKFDGKSGKNIVDNNHPLAGTKGIGESNFSGDLDSLYNYLKQNGYNGNNEIGNMQSFYISQDPDLVANYMLFVRPNNKAIEIWNKKYALDGQKAKSYKDVNMSLMSKEDRIAAFKDYKWDYRAPKFKQKVVETPVVTKPGLKSDTPSKIESIKGGFDSGNLKFQKPNITALAFDNYLRDPITSYPLDPQYVNPRYLDINPELNDINRDIATGLSYVTDRTGNSIANVANILNQARAGKQKTYGSKYQYDRQQDQWAEGTNAQTKMNIDTQNLNNYITNVRNPILQREATITEQQQLNNNAQLKEQAEREHEQAVKDYLSEVYNPNYALNENFSNPYNLKSYKVESEEAKKAKAIETLLGTNKKFGGKVKIKAKKKK